MFFGNFKEANEKRIDLQCDYAALKEILRVVHHVSRDFDAVGGQNEYDLDTLKKLYVTADMLDFPVVRKLCEAQMLNRPLTEMADVAVSMGLHDLLMTLLMKMDVEDMETFLSDENTANFEDHRIFTKKDVAVIYKKQYGEKLPPGVVEWPNPPLSLKKISKELKDPRIDLTRKWQMSDVALLTKNSRGRLLYSMKRDLPCYSDYFQKMFFGKDLESRKVQEVVPVEVEYATMKEILSFIHRCDLNFSGITLIHPVLLYDMYLAVSEDNLDIPIIRRFCGSNLLEQRCVTSFEVAVKLGLSDVKSHFLKILPQNDLRDWVMGVDRALSYLRDGKEVVITTGSEEQVLSVGDLMLMMERLHHVYGKKAVP